MRDFIEGNPDRDVVDRKPYEQAHLKAMDNPAFNSYFFSFLRDRGKPPPPFSGREKYSGKRGGGETEKRFTPEEKRKRRGRPLVGVFAEDNLKETKKLAGYGKEWYHYYVEW